MHVVFPTSASVRDLGMEVGLDKLQASKPCKSHKPSVKINYKKENCKFTD